jgi:chromosome segregation ATPase
VELLHAHQAELESQQQQLADTRAELETQKREAEAALTILRGEYEASKLDASAQTELAAERLAVIEQQEQDLVGARERIAALEAREAALQQTVNNLEAQRARLLQQSESLEQRLEELVASHADELADTKSQVCFAVSKSLPYTKTLSHVVYLLSLAVTACSGDE